MNVTPELDARFREAALARGARRRPLRRRRLARRRRCFVAATPRGLCRISYTVEGQDEALARMFGVARPARAARRGAPRARRVLRGPPPRLRPAARPARRAVPRGGAARARPRPVRPTDTYGALAAQVGRPKAARAVGTVMNRNPIPIVLPCHRIVGANGSLTGYAGGLHAKRALLELEGATLPRDVPRQVVDG